MNNLNKLEIKLHLKGPRERKRGGPSLIIEWGLRAWETKDEQSKAKEIHVAQETKYCYFCCIGKGA